MSSCCKGSCRYDTTLRGVCSLPGLMQKYHRSSRRTGTGTVSGLQAVSVPKGLQCSLGEGRESWNGLQKAKTLEHKQHMGMLFWLSFCAPRLLQF